LSSVTAVAVGFFFLRQTWNKGDLFGRDDAPAVLIPAASSIMGDDEDSPRRNIYLNAFYMDMYEVTVSRYAKFLTATGTVRPPEAWPGENNAQFGDLPVVGVDWWDANSYCRWADRRLPTEAEWERAARGSNGRKYPWGNDAPSADQARFGRSYQDEVYKDGVAQVGTHTKDQSRSACTISPATCPNGWRIGMRTVFPVPMCATRQDRQPEWRRYCGAGGGMIRRTGSPRPSDGRRVRIIAQTRLDSGAHGM
jgi:Sulfatase-modifying factor enzyme 1